MMSFLLPFLKELSTGEKAVAVRASRDVEPSAVAAGLKLPAAAGVLMLSGGAGYMSEEMYDRLGDLFTAIGKMLAQANITVVDGGTRSGVVALIGPALAQANRTSPYIGVLPAQAEIEPGGLRGEDILEPHHSHFVLVESDQWGDEVQLMYGLAEHLAHQAPSIALLVNGGGISLREIEWNVRQRREIIVVAGSGRLADEIAAAARHPQREAREPVRAIVRDGRLVIFDLTDPSAELVSLLKTRLT